MNRKTLIALSAFVVLALVTLFALRAPDKGEVAGDQPRPIPALKKGDFDTLAVTKAKATTIIKKDGDHYRVVAPIEYPADEPAAKQAFDSLETLTFGNLVSDQKAKHAEFEVADDGLRIAAKKGDKVLADLLVGKSLGSGTMVRIAGGDQVWQVNGSIRHLFDKETTGWRDKSITTFEQPDVQKIEVKSKNGDRIIVAKSEQKDSTGEDSWTVVESTVKVDKVDGSVPNGMLGTLFAWKGNDFADGATPEQTGLATPETTVTVHLKDGKAVTALIGNKRGEDELYVKRADSPQVFVVKKYNVERVNKRPIEFRQKLLCDLSDLDLTEVSVVHGSDSFTIVRNEKGWKAVRPAGLALDSTKLGPITGGFKDWKATAFAEDSSPKVTGLAKPKATITAKGKGKADNGVCTIKIGQETSDKQNYFAQTARSPDVYTVAKWATDRLLPKVDDLKAK